MWKSLALALCLLTGTATVLVSQTFYGSMLGSVADPSGSVLPQTAVTLINSATGERRTMQTDDSGGYQFLNLPPGQYRLEVEKSGFRRFVRDPITVEVQSAVRIDVGMQVGEVTQTVEVTGQTPLIQ